MLELVFGDLHGHRKRKGFLAGSLVIHMDTGSGKVSLLGPW